LGHCFCIKEAPLATSQRARLVVCWNLVKSPVAPLPAGSSILGTLVADMLWGTYDQQYQLKRAQKVSWKGPPHSLSSLNSWARRYGCCESCSIQYSLIIIYIRRCMIYTRAAGLFWIDRFSGELLRGYIYISTLRALLVLDGIEERCVGLLRWVWDVLWDLRRHSRRCLRCMSLMLISLRVWDTSSMLSYKWNKQ
jgi:hypothetical protein